MVQKGHHNDAGDAPGPLVLGGAMAVRAAPDAGLQSKDRAVPRPRKPRRDRALGLRLLLVLLAFSIIAAGFSLKLKPLSLPILAVAEVEDRLNQMSSPVLPGARISLGGIEVMLGDEWQPEFRLQDLRLLQAGGGQTFLALPEARMSLDGQALLRGRLLPQGLMISGAHVDLTRDLNGKINLSLKEGAGPAVQSLSEFFDGIDAALALPELAQLKSVEFDALSLTLVDERLKKTWEFGDGRLVAENRATEVAAQIAISFLNGQGAQALMTAVATKGTKTARISADITDIPASELAAQHPVLAWMAALDAPISGRLSAQIRQDGIEALSAELSVGAGKLQPSPGATPIDFTKAGLKLSYDPEGGRLRLSDLTVESKTLRARAEGQVLLLDAQGQIQKGTLTAASPAAFLGQLTLSDVRIDPEGLFEAPVQFAHGALDLRLTPEPFSVDIGQFTLSDGTQKLTLTGTASAAEAGWTAALDMAMNEVSVKKLMQLWPLRLVPKTRAWSAKNLVAGDLSDVNGAIRLSPGTEPRLHLDYDYANAEIKFMANMPPIQRANGFSVIDGRVNTIQLIKGSLTAPEGGTIDLAGSSMRVLDITEIPAKAAISLRGRGPAVAMLSILDQKPFEYMQKAGRPVALGQGEAVMRAEVRTPLGKAKPENVTFEAQARISGFASQLLVDGRTIVVPDLQVVADNSGMTARGKGTIDGVDFDGAYRLPFGANAGAALVTGSVEVSPRTVAAFDLGLPKNMVKGRSSGRITISLPKGAAPELSLTTDLNGAVLSIPELGWTKPAGGQARLEVGARLSSPIAVKRISFTGAGLSAEGSAAFRENGRLDVARFSDVKMGAWLDGSVEIKGTNPLSFAVTSGSIDFREFPSASQRGSSGGGSATGSPLSLKLNEFRVTDSIRLNEFRGDFTLGAEGVNGQFSGQLGGEIAVSGGVAPEAFGTAVRVVSSDAGGALKAAGIFDSARGGTVDLRLTPRAEEGVYDGRADISGLRVRNANVLADLLNAISVIGLLEQLNGSGIVFNSAEADFVLSPTQVQVSRSSAVGASMGVSMEGTYQTETGALRMGGVVSPIYLLNGIGAFLTRKGEGLFGFTYRLDGTADDPEVGVNPLSILTPGMFREIFRRPPPKPAGTAP